MLVKKLKLRLTKYAFCFSHTGGMQPKWIVNILGSFFSILKSFRVWMRYILNAFRTVLDRFEYCSRNKQCIIPWLWCAWGSRSGPWGLIFSLQVNPGSMTCVLQAAQRCHVLRARYSFATRAVAGLGQVDIDLAPSSPRPCRSTPYGGFREMDVGAAALEGELRGQLNGERRYSSDFSLWPCG